MRVLGLALPHIFGLDEPFFSPEGIDGLKIPVLLHVLFVRLTIAAGSPVSICLFQVLLTQPLESLQREYRISGTCSGPRDDPTSPPCSPYPLVAGPCKLPPKGRTNVIRRSRSRLLASIPLPSPCRSTYLGESFSYTFRLPLQRQTSLIGTTLRRQSEERGFSIPKTCSLDKNKYTIRWMNLTSKDAPSRRCRTRTRRCTRPGGCQTDVLRWACRQALSSQDSRSSCCPLTKSGTPPELHDASAGRNHNHQQKNSFSAL